MEPIYPRFGRELKRVRKAKGMTQAELAAAVGGLGRTSIVNIEKGQQRVHLHTLLDLATALGVKPAELLPVARAEAPAIVAKAGTLSTPELDWVIKVTETRTRKRAKRRESGDGETTKQIRASRARPSRARGARGADSGPS